MEILGHLLEGFGIAFLPLNLGLAIFGCLLGLFIGAMPGLGSVNGVAILLPLTFLVPPTSAVIFLGAIYYGAMYGGAISSIMLGIPGASTAVATTFDGRPLARKGMADRALVAAATASFVGGTISIVLFTLFAPPLAEVALVFGAPEEFALMLLAFATFIGLGGDDIPKTFFSIFIGLVLSAVGLDIMSGQPRLIFFDVPGFFHGINFLVLAIGIYGIGEILWTIETSHKGVEVSQASLSVRRFVDAFRSLAGTAKTMLMGSFLGYFVGILPAAGATPGSLMAYGVARSIAKDPDSFGKGNVNGVVAPESANNAASTGSMLPMLTLGIPGSPTTAILLGGHGDLGSRARSDAVHRAHGLRLGAHREPLRGEPLRAHPEPRLHPGVHRGAQAAVHHPRACHLHSVPRRRLRAHPGHARHLADVPFRRRRVPAAQARLPDGPGGARDRAGAARGNLDAPVAPHRPRLTRDSSSSGPSRAESWWLQSCCSRCR